MLCHQRYHYFAQPSLITPWNPPNGLLDLGNVKQPLHLQGCVRSHLEALVDARVNEMLAQRSLELLLVPCLEDVVNHLIARLINERLAAAGIEPSDLVDSCHTIHLPYDQMGRVDGVDGIPSPLPILSASYGDGTLPDESRCRTTLLSALLLGIVLFRQQHNYFAQPHFA
ncbi:hypothetical protein H0G86_013336 [Trichoderma simmonsii]|uniref:Uncharacterized protein n=1 Tax=Trichoderma simmonsii TaxID=1491479 RepID=A0A8G0PKF7_9HYPO|nr:hypothetical protein H0G86_013336 [Trichoderma simmonsii]